MFNLLSAVAVLLSVVSTASALAIPRSDSPSTYAEGYLEDYDVYHKRYMDLGCNLKHDTDFFDQCCHPMLATETLEKNRAPQCNPANQVTSSISSTPISNTFVALPTETDDPDCDDDEEPTPQPASATPAPSSSSTSLSSSKSSSSSSKPSSSSAAPTSSVAPVAPVNAGGAPPSSSTPTSTPPPAPTTHTTTSTSTTSTPPPPPTSTSSAHTSAPTTSAAPPAGGDVHTGGIATFFFQNGVAGACGTVHKDTDFVAALDTALYGDTGKQSSHCGQKVQITNTKNGKQVTVTVADACPTCENANSIDLSVSAFEQIATQAEGIADISWTFL